jgi:hypothetical protein
MKAATLDRISIIQTVLDATGRGTYLEIGVCTGESFIPTRANRKWGVDPGHALSWKRLSKYKLFSLLGLKDERIFREESDKFFEAHADILRKHGVDVAFVDGLHTYAQAHRDIENSLRHLNQGGYVLAHDCNPESAAAAVPASDIAAAAAEAGPDWSGAWNGDVWKAIVHLRSTRDDLRVHVLDCDNGVGVVWRGAPTERLSYSPGEICEMDYADLERDRIRLLGLRPPSFLNDVLRGAAG